MNGDGLCALCGRRVARLNRHHLLPRARARNKRVRREFTPEERGQTLMLCRPCHDQVHTLLTPKELEDCRTAGDLAAHPGMQRFIRWIAGRPDGTPVAVRRKNARQR